MKNILILFLLFSINPSFVMGQKIEFEQSVHELDDIDLVKLKDSVVYYDFKFKNSGDAPLKIKNILSSCGCFTSEWSKESYAPGSTGTIRLSYYPFQGREEKITLSAEVYTNSKNNGTQGIHNLRLSASILGERAPLKHITLLNAVINRLLFQKLAIFTRPFWSVSLKKCKMDMLQVMI